MDKPRYVIISPVRDEQDHIRKTIASIAAQPILPAQWVIVNDGSRDNTGLILEEAAKQYPWIKAIHRSDRGFRKPGGGVIEAFYDGYRALEHNAWDYVVKLDCDLSLEADYFEKLLARFAAEPRLGIASGVYLELFDGQEWVAVEMPSYHAAGACKVIRRQCFEEIGGFIGERGWDTVDEIQAISRGWCTGHFRDLKMKHWKSEGMGIGLLRTSFMHGEIYHLTSGSKLFFLLKVLHRMTCRPLLIGGLALVCGYLRGVIERRPHLVTETEARSYNSLLYDRIAARVKTLL